MGTKNIAIILALSTFFAFLPLDVSVAGDDTLYDYCLKIDIDRKTEVVHYVTEEGIAPSVRKGHVVTPFSQYFRAVGEGHSRNLVLVPVGYPAEEIDEAMIDIIDTLDYAFEGVNAMFSYLSVSVDLNVSRRKVLGLINDREMSIVLKTIREQFPVHDVALVVYSDLYFATSHASALWQGRSSVFSGGSRASFYSAVHETGHTYDLNDGYERCYGEDGLDGSELFLNVESLRPGVQEVYWSLRPSVVLAGLCGDRPVYRFSGGSDKVHDAMSDSSRGGWVSDEQFVHLRRRGYKFFTEFQKAVMNEYIRRSLAPPYYDLSLLVPLL